ncbi:MAG: 3'-5' exonuclease, partial [Pseudomonadota bacterium]
ILRFETDFPGAMVIRLERNYRSTSHILGAASGLIKTNEARLGKTLWTEASGGDEVSLKGLWDSEAEARFICEEIETLQRRDIKLDQIAVLVRASFQMREFEDRFLTLNIPYRVVGGPRFYERQEIRDAHAYLRLVHNPDNDLAFERIINVPKRGIGKAALQTLHQVANARGTPLLRAARLVLEKDEVKGKAKTSLGHFVLMIERFQNEAQSLPHPDLAAMIVDDTGYTEMWQNDKSANAPSRLENLKELVQGMEAFASLGEYLDHVSLVMDREQADTDERVHLMTLHAAKGLEFDTVFLPGWEEGLFPHQRSLDEGKRGLEEERRLAYVGLTRAKKKAYVTFVNMRQTHGRWQNGLPSRFIDELPAGHVVILTEDDAFAGISRESRFGAAPNFESSYENPGWRRAQSRLGGSRAKAQSRPTARLDEARDLIATSDPAASSFMPGERVFHLKFGYGLVTEADGNKLVVDFEKAGVKRVIDSFVSRP